MFSHTYKQLIHFNIQPPTFKAKRWTLKARRQTRSFIMWYLIIYVRLLKTSLKMYAAK